MGNFSGLAVFWGRSAKTALRIVQRCDGWLGAGGEDGGVAFAEAEAGVPGGFAGAAEDDLVSVGEEGAEFSGGKEDGLGSVAGEFKEAAGGGFGGAGDGSGGEEVTDLEVATVAGVMGDELRWGPVEIAGVGLTEEMGWELVVSHGLSCYQNFKFYVRD
jgi:hypothetical protein